MLVILGLPLAGLLAHNLDQNRESAPLESAVYLRSPKAIKFMTMGQTGLAACVYWTRVVQYFGNQHHDQALRFDLLQPLLTLTTELDPQLSVAYEFGSIFLAQRPPEGAGLPDEAVRFVEAGIRNNPGVWRLYYHLGFIHYIERQDYKAAADAFDRGSKVPGAHPWMKIMAASMAQKGGDIETAQFFWTKVYESSEDKMIRDNALVRLKALRVDQEVTGLESLVASYRQKYKTCPSAWREMIAVGALPGTPIDPTGMPYVLRPECRIEVFQYDRFPFIRKGLPPNKTSSEFIMPGMVGSKVKKP